MAQTEQQNKEVVYYYDEEVGNFYYGQNHPMKPHRMRMTHSLIVNYGLFKKMQVYRPYRLKEREMTLFHADDYIHFLRTVTPDNEATFGTDLDRFNIDIDCPIFDGVYRFCQISSGGSVGAAYKLNHSACDIGINWAGGLHHAKKCEASGFCYVNDIVLSILELLKFHDRVLYIDIDIHHGDGVEEAFYTTDRVMTLSFHKYGDFFPGTGHINDKGVGKGKYHSINVPLYEGMTDDTYLYCFKPILKQIMAKFQPGAIVLQLGADSLAGDRLGCFNLSISGHGECVREVLKCNVPTMLLGGGGYTLRNVARCWTYETSIACNVELDPKLPYHEYYEYFAPDYTLATIPTNMLNINKKSYLDETITKVFQYLSKIESSPSINVQDSHVTLGIANRLQQIQAQIGTKEENHNFNENDNNNNDIITKQKIKNNEFLPFGNDIKINANNIPAWFTNNNNGTTNGMNATNGTNGTNNKNNGNVCGAPEWDGVLNNTTNGAKKRSPVSIRSVKTSQGGTKGIKEEKERALLDSLSNIPTIEQEKHFEDTIEDNRNANDFDNKESRISTIKQDKIKDDKREIYENNKDNDINMISNTNTNTNTNKNKNNTTLNSNTNTNKEKEKDKNNTSTTKGKGTSPSINISGTFNTNIKLVQATPKESTNTNTSNIGNTENNTNNKKNSNEQSSDTTTNNNNNNNNNSNGNNNETAKDKNGNNKATSDGGNENK